MTQNERKKDKNWEKWSEVKSGQTEINITKLSKFTTKSFMYLHFGVNLTTKRTLPERLIK